MSTVAEQLHQAREERQLTVHQVAEATKIRTDHIEALENGDYDVFPASVYIRGFVRTYATFLRMDVPKILGELNSELSKTEKHREAPALTAKSPNLLDWFMFQLSRINWRWAFPMLLLTMVALISVYGYRAWKIRESRDPLSDLGPGLYQPGKTNNGDLLPIPAPAQPVR
ncbi:MAG: helix-turn-helix domain-containing protein [Verrucomicrobia bacterium]|nr:helix-turn-helix domain-containing protein [Verrucomicrobiota bacterium]